MGNNAFKHNILTSRGFKLISNGMSDYFGDCFDVYSNDDCLIKYSCLKSLYTVDVGSVLDVDRWFDLILIKGLITNEQDFTKVVTITEYNNLLESHFTNICDLFCKKNYFVTKKQLELLEYKRIKQLFPDVNRS